MSDASEFRVELEQLINRQNMENVSDTPDFILADYLVACLAAFNSASERREKWYGRKRPKLEAKEVAND